MKGFYFAWGEACRSSKFEALVQIACPVLLRRDISSDGIEEHFPAHRTAIVICQKRKDSDSFKGIIEQTSDILIGSGTDCLRPTREIWLFLVYCGR